jgi:hypothetical protein
VPLESGYFAHDLSGVGGQHVVLHGRLQLAEPPGGELSEHGSLVRDSLSHHYVERAHPVSRDQQKALFVNHVDVTDLAAAIGSERKRARRHQGQT